MRKAKFLPVTEPKIKAYAKVKATELADEYLKQGKTIAANIYYSFKASNGWF